jgi:hypothetical protein
MEIISLAARETAPFELSSARIEARSPPRDG